MSKKVLFPHVPKKKEPLFPHTPKTQKLERLPQTREEIKNFWVEMNPEGTWAIVEAFPGGTVRSPFKTNVEAIKREHDIAAEYGWNLKQVPSPQEKFAKQHEALQKLYPYEILEYHSDGDLTIQLLIPRPRGQMGFKKGDIVLVTTEGHVFKESELLPETIKLLPAVVLEDLTKEVCYDFRAIRSAVMKRAWEIMDKEKVSFHDAIKRAWEEVKKQCWKLGAVV
jgi:hypothetical protein